MNLYLKIILIIFGLAYLISPVDIIPDLLLPYIGWLDDGVVLWSIYYLIRHGRLPNYFSKQKKTNTKAENHQDANPQQKRSRSNNTQSQANAYSKKEKKSEKKKKPDPKTAWEILDIPETAGKKEIQDAYKEAIKKYHPDKLSHLGEEFSTLANEKFLEIQAAYDQLMKKYI